MGFDIEGIASTEAVGEYFRNNVWWWRPMAGAIESTCSDLLTEKQKQGLYFNDGVEYEDELAINIAGRLEENMDKLEVYVRPIQEQLNFKTSKGVEFEYPFSIENVKAFIEFARHSGGFKIW
tara:strand:+ start:458 stop:823 length:366 start_codon:yes stop_codon:yes gene_type:complete